MDKLELQLLGGFQVRLDGKALSGFSYNTLRALLAYLAVEPPREHQREFLAGLFWEDQELGTARGNLRRTLSDLRRAIETPSGKRLFIAGKQTLRFIPDLAVDLLSFSEPLPACGGPSASRCRQCLPELEQIAERYRGEFLYGFSLPGCTAFEEWLLMQRESLHRRALALFERIAICHEHIGQYARALPFAQRYVEMEPIDESGHRRVMRLYALDHQPGVALHQYNNCCQWLKKELGALPEEETRTLAQRIRNGELTASPNAMAAHTPVERPFQQPIERRQVTVIYCELALEGEEGDDPDEALERLLEPQAQALDMIRSHDGHIVQAHGGGLLAYFGYPRAHENASRHAVQAALSISRLAGLAVAVRIGVHTGMIITSSDPSLPDTVGKTSRTAIALRHGVGHDGVVISQSTHRLIEGYFDCMPLGEALPDKTAPALRTYRVERESGALTRLDAAASMTPMTGRKTELAHLSALWRQAGNGVGSALLLRGDAGIGKSRLIHDFRRMLGDEAPAVFEMRCTAEHAHTPFHPLIGLLEHLFGFERNDEPEQKLHKLSARLGRGSDDVVLLAKLLGLPLQGEEHQCDIAAQEWRERTFSLLIGLALSMAADKRILMIWEDVHWADHSTLEFIDRYLALAARTGVLTLMTARREFIPAWKTSGVDTLTLPPLDKGEVTQMIVSLDAHLPGDTVAHIIDKTDGIPLYIEEVVRDISSGQTAIVPASLRDLLMMRIDGIGEARKIAQLAACIGREFDLGLLRASTDCSERTMQEGFVLLRRAGMVEKLGKNTAQFRHALIQEVCYQSQTRADRAAAHHRIAQALLTAFPHVASTAPEVLARHFHAAGDALKGSGHWLSAGRRALAGGANREAIEHLNAARNALEAVPPSQARERLAMELHLNLGMAWMGEGGYGCIESQRAYAMALKLGDDAEDKTGLFSALRGLWMAEFSGGGHELSIDLAAQMLQLAREEEDPVLLQVAHQAMGATNTTMGNLRGGQHHFERSLALYQPPHHDIMLEHHGEDIAINSGVQLAIVLWLRGYPDQARERAELTLEIARSHQHPHGLCFALNGCAVIARWRGDVEASARYSDEYRVLAEEAELPFWQLMGSVSRTWVTAMRGQQAETLALIEQFGKNDGDIPDRVRLLLLHQLANGLVHLHHYAKALDLLDEAMPLADNVNERHEESEFHRLRGESLLGISAGREAEAETCFGRALAISRQQGALSLELRAATSLAGLWWQTGRAQDAAKLMEGVCQRFEEGFETRDYRNAQALLLGTQGAPVSRHAPGRRDGRGRTPG